MTSSTLHRSLALFVMACLIAASASAETRKTRGTAKTNVSHNTNVNNNTNINRNTNVNRNVNRDIDIDVDVHHHYGYGYGCCYHPVATAAAVVGAAVITAAVVGSMVNTLPPSCSAVMYGNVTYQHCGSTWYQPQFAGTSVTYIVVNAPN